MAAPGGAKTAAAVEDGQSQLWSSQTREQSNPYFVASGVYIELTAMTSLPRARPASRCRMALGISLSG